MAISMQELFYGHNEPVYFLESSYARHMDRSHQAGHQASYAPAVPEHRMDRFDLMVPMCCARCEHEIRNALFALRGVRDVVCDALNQRVTVTGFLEPALALKQASEASEERRHIVFHATKLALQQRCLLAKILSRVQRLHGDALHELQSAD